MVLQIQENTNLFEKKRIEDFSKKIRDVFNLLTISRTYRVIGSASLKNIKYSADYDLTELFEENQLISKDKMLDKILKLFQKKFDEAEKDDNIFITDFKCGMNEEGEPLRWDKSDIKNGFKILESGRKITFQDCILMKTTMKLDVVSFIDGIATEFTDNYLIKLGDDSNFFPHDISREHQMNSIKHSFDEYFYAQRNYFKGLKRCFSYYLLDGESKHYGKLKTLLEFFNSVVGIIYKLISEIDTVMLLLENNFRKPTADDLKRNIKIILDGVVSIEESDDAEKYLSLAMKDVTAKNMKKNLEKSKSFLKNVLDKKTLVFINKNKNVLLF